MTWLLDSIRPRRPELARYVLDVCSASLMLSAAGFALASWRWRLTGDAALMHYVGFLIGQGRYPYRDVWDINFPGAYVPDWIFQHFFGPSALPWRLYDLALLLLVAAVMSLRAGPRHWFAALWASSLFAVVHGRDGMEQLGQRDLLAGLLLMTAVALIPLVPGRQLRLRWLAFGLCVGMASTVKPLFALFLVLCFCVSSSGLSWQKCLLYGTLGFAVPFLLCAGWLLHWGVVPGFLFTLRVLLPFHARLGHVALHTLLYKSVSPFLPIVLVWAVLLLFWTVRGRSQPSPGDAALYRVLFVAAAVGMACFLLQDKGFPYQRYPLLLPLLLLIGLHLAEWIRSNRRTLRWAAISLLLWSSLVLAPASALKTARYDWRSNDFNEQLTAHLRELGVSGGKTSSKQPTLFCLDTVSGCLSVLEDMQAVQSNSNLYDEFLFTRSSSQAVADVRSRVREQLQQHQPELIIETNRTFPDGDLGFAKVSTWPWFAEWLSEDYCVVADWHPSRKVRWMGGLITPPSFRIYENREVTGLRCSSAT